MNLANDVARCGGWPEERETVRPDDLCRGCKRWLNRLNNGARSPHIPPAAVWRIDESGSRMHCVNLIKAE